MFLPKRIPVFFPLMCLHIAAPRNVWHFLSHDVAESAGHPCTVRDLNPTVGGPLPFGSALHHPCLIFLPDPVWSDCHCHSPSREVRNEDSGRGSPPPPAPDGPCEPATVTPPTSGRSRDSIPKGALTWHDCNLVLKGGKSGLNHLHLLGCGQIVTKLA